MKTLAPWGGELKREMERFFDRFAEPMWGPYEGMAGDWAPKLDVAETKDAFVVRAEMPGVDPKELEIALTGDMLTLKGEKERETEKAEERYHRVERTSAASGCRWRWTEARSPRRSRTDCWS